MAGTDDSPLSGDYTSKEDEEFAAWLAEEARPPDANFILSATGALLGNLKDALRDGANVNTRHPGTGATALHYAASMKARDVINWLAKCDGIDYLIRDNKGRLPSALAYEVADDPAIGRFLVKKQNEQARAHGIDISTLLTS